MLVTIVLSVIFLILILAVIEDSKDMDTRGIWCTVILGVFVGILSSAKRELLDGFVNSFDLIEFALFFLGYLLLGALWSIFKWWKYCEFWHNEYLKDKKKFTDITIDSYIPQLSSSNIARIGSWIFWWPFFLIRYLIADILGELRDKIINSLSKVYEKIARSKFKE